MRYSLGELITQPSCTLQRQAKTNGAMIEQAVLFEVLIYSKVRVEHCPG